MRGGLLRARVGLVIDGGELVGGELGIALGGAEALVAEEFLDGAQIRALLKQVGTEGVAQRVGVNVGRKAARNCDVLDDASDTPGGKPASAAQMQVEDEGFGFAVGGLEAGQPLAKVGSDGVGRGIS